MISLIYLSSWPIGGSTSFTVHLYQALKLTGADVQIIKIGKRSEKKDRPLSKYGLTYRRLTLDDLLARKTTMLITAALSKNGEIDHDMINTLLKNGARSMVFDANELKVYNDRSLLVRPIAIRESNRRYAPDAVVLHSPYLRRRFDDKHFDHGTRKHAVSIARTSFTKNSHMILEANRKVPPELAVDLRGQLHRSFMFRFKKDYPELMTHKMGFPATLDGAVDICSQYLAMVDLTVFEQDGGASQYSFMEAMDAGAICIVHRGWLSFDPANATLREGVNCLAVESADELAQTLIGLQEGRYDITSLVRGGYEFIKQYDAALLGEQYRKELGA